MAPTSAKRSAQPNKIGLLAQVIRDARLTWRLIKDPRVPLATKLVIPSVIGLYLLSPIDAVPDVLPFLGQVDDLAVLLVGITLFLELCPKDLVEEHRRALARSPQNAREAGYDGETVDAEYRVIE